MKLELFRKIQAMRSPGTASLKMLENKNDLFEAPKQTFIILSA